MEKADSCGLLIPAYLAVHCRIPQYGSLVRLAVLWSIKSGIWLCVTG